MPTRSRFIISLAGTALATLALAGCASSPGSTNGGGGSSSSSSPSPAKVAASAVLATATTSVGTIVVDGKGMTAYMFDKDTQNSGTSACAGQCAALWPAITTTAATPDVTGVTGTIGTITGTGGGKQITVNGWPVYTFSKDAKPGDTTGQGFGGIWWVLSPAGEKITTVPEKSGY